MFDVRLFQSSRPSPNLYDNGWVPHGGRGIIGEVGLIRLTGRIKDEINRAGFKVQPAEIDMLLETHPEVAEACVFGIPDSISAEAIGAEVRLLTLLSPR